MNALDHVTIGMPPEKTVTVTVEMTVGHFVAGMPQVYATPMMILYHGNRVTLRHRIHLRDLLALA